MHVLFRAGLDTGELRLLGRSKVIIRVDVIRILHQVLWLIDYGTYTLCSIPIRVDLRSCTDYVVSNSDVVTCSEGILLVSKVRLCRIDGQIRFMQDFLYTLCCSPIRVQLWSRGGADYVVRDDDVVTGSQRILLARQVSLRGIDAQVRLMENHGITFCGSPIGVNVNFRACLDAVEFLQVGEVKRIRVCTIRQGNTGRVNRGARVRGVAGDGRATAIDHSRGVS